MKIISRIKTTFINLGKSVERFPITVALSSILAILLIIFNESISKMSVEQMEDFSKINMTVGLGIIVSVCIGLLIERLFYGDKIKSLVSYAIGALALFAYYRTLLPSFDFVPISRFVALVFVFTIGFFFIPWLKKKDRYEIYVIKVFSSLLTTWVYSAVLYFGLSAILFTTNTLFDLDIDGKYYYYIFLFVGLIFAVALLLSKIPGKADGLEEYSLSRSLKVLLLYIVIPLVSVYTLILYAYFAKILFTSEWPKGLVSHLVLWYSAISVGIIFLITPILEENQIAKLFKTWFPKVIIPILGMMFVSIWIRINQYGLTENRYYVVLLGIWITGIMIYFSIIKPLRNIIIPITLSITLIIAVFGPLSGYSLSIKSQNGRFTEILNENNMLENGSIIKNPSINSEGKKELSNIISYFENTHDFKDLEVLPDDFSISKMEDIFGFAHSPQYGFEDQEYFYYHLDLFAVPIPIGDYETFVQVNTFDNQLKTVDDLSYQYDTSSHVLTIKKGNQTLLSANIFDHVKEIYQKKGQTEKDLVTSVDDMSFEVEKEGLKVKIIFTNISGQNNPDEKDIKLESAEFILMIMQK